MNWTKKSIWNTDDEMLDCDFCTEAEPGVLKMFSESDIDAADVSKLNIRKSIKFKNELNILLNIAQVYTCFSFFYK